MAPSAPKPIGSGGVTDGEESLFLMSKFHLIDLWAGWRDASSSKGTFKIDLPEGDYIAIPSKPGFEPESINFNFPQGDTRWNSRYPSLLERHYHFIR
jgi:hypothetical protein